DIVKPAIFELLDGSLPEDQNDEIGKIIESVEGVKGYHNLRTRKIGNSIAVDVHVKMDGNMPLFEAHEIASRIENEIRTKYGKDCSIYIHMEPMKSILAE
ncbi:MAG: cation-efflux pump, partial [Muribaculaceae bacterium]|nr:cation-efflux pump [Muribaculaceae bacterium]